MSIYVYAPTLYPGTRELIEALQAKRLVKHDGMNFLHKGRPMQFSNQDAIVNWGHHVPPIAGVPCLNANYKYPNLLAVNTTGIRDLINLGHNAFTMRKIPKEEQARSLVGIDYETWWPKGKYRNIYVGIPELDGYGIEYYAFTHAVKVPVFCDKIPETPDMKDATDYAIRHVDALKLDFANVYIGVHADTYYVLKIVTAPALTNEESVKSYADKITAWAKSVLLKE